MFAKGRSFTEAEDAFLRLHHTSMRHKDISNKLGRPLRTISDRLARLDLRRFKTKAFSSEEDAVIRGAQGRTSADIGKQLGRDPGVIRTRARRLGMPPWKEMNGGLKDFRGYKVTRIDRGDGSLARRVGEHRDTMEKIIGRPLTEEERVHHINGRKRDNWPDNLFLCANTTTHTKAHHSLQSLLPDLLANGAVVFDRAAGVYCLGERIGRQLK